MDLLRSAESEGCFWCRVSWPRKGRCWSPAGCPGCALPRDSMESAGAFRLESVESAARCSFAAGASAGFLSSFSYVELIYTILGSLGGSSGLAGELAGLPWTLLESESSLRAAF